MVRILIVEHKKGELELLRKPFESAGCSPTVVTATFLKDVQRALLNGEYDLILSDFRTPHFTGLELLQFLQTQPISTPVVFFSNGAEDTKAGELSGQGALGIVPRTKSHIPDLPTTVLDLLYQSRFQRKETALQDRVAESERRYRMLFERAREGIAVFDSTGVLLEANPFIKDITGFDPKDLVGRNFMDVLSPEERVKAGAMFSELKERGWARGEFSLRRNDGRVVILDFSTVEVDKGIFQCVFRDITERKKREEEIFEQNNVLFAISDVAFSLMESMKLDQVLDAAIAKIKDITKGQFVGIYLLDKEGKELNLVAHSESSSRVLPLISRFDVNKSLTGEAVRAGRSMYVSSQLHKDTRITAKGRQMAEQEGWEAIAAIPLKAQDEVLGAMDVLFTHPREISTSERQMFTIIGSLVGAALDNARLYEQTLEKSKEIELRNRELSDFTYVVSHDLKEPLVGIEGFSKILMNHYGAQLDEKARDHLNTLSKLSSQMKALINDLLKYARIGDEDLAEEFVDTNEIIDHLQEELEFYVQQQNAKITTVSPLPKVMYPVVALTEVFRNLISNAIKFNEKGRPVVEIGCESDETEHRFFVRDNGLGILSEFFEKIYLIFERLNHPEQYEGTGIGLTIAKKIVESNGGRIWVESKEGIGSTFHFTVSKRSERSP